MVFSLFVKFDHHVSGEGPAGLGAETVQRTDLALAQELLHFNQLKGAPGRRLAKREAATVLCAGLARAGVAAVVFLDHAAAIGAGRLQGGVIPGDGVAVVLLGFFDHALGHGRYLGHEAAAAELAEFHLRELVFPLACQLGFGQFFHAQAAQQRHQLEGLGGRNQLAAFAQHVLFGDQPLDDGRAGGGRAQAFLLHGLAQFVVFHGFAGTFHGTQQGRLRVACGWPGL